MKTTTEQPKQTAKATAHQHDKQKTAETVSSLMPPKSGIGFTDNQVVQTKSLPISASPNNGVVQMMVDDEEDVVQLKQGVIGAASPATGLGTDDGLPNTLKSGIESLSGMSMDDVSVHYNSTAPSNLGALAYAQGNNIHVAPGQEQHLPHEAWHVVQQRQGRVKPTFQAKGLPVNDDGGLEKEADIMGAKALRLGATTEPTAIQKKGKTSAGSASKAPIQMIFGWGKKKKDEEIVRDDTMEEMAERDVKPDKTKNKKRINFNSDRARDYLEYTGAGIGAAAAGSGGVTKGIGYAVNIGQNFKNVDSVKTFGSSMKEAVSKVPNQEAVGASAQAISYVGAIGGGIGAINSLMDAHRGYGEMTNKAKTTGDRVVGGGGRMASGLASATQNSAVAAYHTSNLIHHGAASASAVGAAAAAGGASVAMGAIDMIRGGYGAIKGNQRKNALDAIARNSSNKDVQSAAQQAASTQEMRRDFNAKTLAKGAVLVAGGAVLLALGASNPIGWALLSGAALVGGIAALQRYKAKRARKKDVAVKELGIQGSYKAYVDGKKEIKKKIKKATWRTQAWKDAQAELSAHKANNPLHKALVAKGYAKDGHGEFYDHYIHDTAVALYSQGVEASPVDENGKQMKKVIENMGLTVDHEKKTPKIGTIARALHV